MVRRRFTARRGGGPRPIRSPYARLFQLVANDEAEDVHRFIERLDLDVEMRINGETAMHVAARNNARNVAQVLNLHHADVNAQADANGFTPLMVGIVRQNRRIVRWLLQHPDVDTDIRDNGGFAAVHHAISTGNLRIIQPFQVIRGHQSFDVRTMRHGLLPLHIAVSNGMYDVFLYLSDLPDFDVDAITTNGRTAFHFAIRRERAMFLPVFADSDADLHATTADGLTAMHMVARNGNTVLAELLMGEPHHLEIDVVDGHNLRPIHHAAIRGHLDMVELLHSSGASLEGILEHASNTGNAEVVQYALLNGAGVERWRVRVALLGASRMGYEDVIHVLLVSMRWNV